MKSKLISVFALFILCNNSVFAQAGTTYTENLIKLNAWVSDIDSIMARTGDGEKLKKISRQLSYVMEVVQNVIEGEKSLVESVSKRSEINEQLSFQMQTLVSQISGDIDQLSDRMKKVQADVSESDKIILEPIIANFNEISQNKDTIKLNYLTAYLYGAKNLDSKLKAETKYTTSVTEKLLENIMQAKEKIKAAISK